MKEIEQIILKMTNKNKNETKEKTGKLITVKNVTFQAHALIISWFFFIPTTILWDSVDYLIIYYHKI